MKPAYPCLHCGRPIALEDTNVATDVALCRACGQSMPFSALTGPAELAGVDLSAPPKGVRVERSLISGIEVTYRKISPAVFFILPFTAVWSGFSLWGIYGRQIASGKFDLMTSLFGLPFVAGTVVLLGVAAFMLFGSWRMRIDRGEAEIFMGVGPVGPRKRIPLDPETSVQLGSSNMRVNGRPQMQVVVVSGEKTVKFGATLDPEVRRFFAAVLRKAASGT